LKNTKLLGAIVIAAIIIFIAPRFVGNYAYKTLQKAERSINELPLYRLKIIEYDQGWFSSKAKVNIHIASAALDKITKSMDRTSKESLNDFKDNGLTFDINIAHGPVMLLDGLHFGLVTTKSEFRPNLDDNDFKLTLNIDVINRINLLGNINSRVTNSAIDIITTDKNEFKLSPIEYSVDINSDFDHYSFDVNKVNLTVKQKNGTEFELKGLSMKGEGSKINDFLWTSEQKLDVTNMNTVKNGKELFNLNNLNYYINIDKLDSETLKVIFKLASSELTVDAAKINDINYNMTLSKLSIKELSNLAELNNKVEDLEFLSAENTAITRDIRKELTQNMLTSGLNILKNSPELNIDELSFKMGDGFFKGHATSNVLGDLITANMTANDFKYFKNFMVANMDITFNEEMVIKMSELSVLKNPRIAAMKKDQIREIASKQAIILLALAIAEKYLLKEGNLYKSSGEFKNNKLTVNGKDVPLPQ
jgi:uncharacterized protein YdgA (DUF945 family)